jgi:TolA-binding protein
MAVFALVQSIPVQETGRPRPKPETRLLQREVRLQQERVQVLQEELRLLTADIATATARHAGAVQAANTAEAQLARALAQTREAQERRERTAGELQELEQQLRQSRRELDGLQQAIADRSDSLQQLGQRLQQARQTLDGVEQHLQVLREQPAPEPVPTPATPAAQEAPTAPRPDAQERGFTLRFASARALERLVEAGTVRLYGMAERQAWRLSLNGGRPAFAPVAFPKWFHEMAPATVPPEYVRSLHRLAAAPAGSATVWGVQLPAATRQDITSLTRGRAGGTLVILADGQVALERE